jgi:2-(1,2-epoxy-1,2-dihydrophenyl)acetyl-CoA isomerase
MDKEDFLLDVEDGIATITFNRPEKVNAMGVHYSARFNQALDRVEADPSVRCLIITGAGNTFNGGGDLHEIMSTDAADMEGELKLIRGYNLLAKRIYYFDIPVIAAVNGPAVGGGAGIAMACDFALASDTARYDLFFQRLGLSAADVGVPWLLNRAIGPGLANYYLLTAGSIDAQTGHRLGLFVDVAAPEKLLDAARAAARKIVDASDRAVRISKLSLRHGVNMDFSANMEVEAYLQSYAFRTPEHKQRIGEYRARLSKKGK